MKRIGIAIATALLLAAIGAAPALASFGIKEVGLNLAKADGSPATQAGSHPDATFSFVVNSSNDPKTGEEIPDGAVKDLAVTLPAGLVANPLATPRCTAVQFVERQTTPKEGRPACPEDTALGYAVLKLGKTGPGFATVAVYNLIPPPGVAAKFGFVALNLPVTIEGGVEKESPYRVTSLSANIVQSALFYGVDLTLWGDPTDESHDPYRGSCMGGNLGTSGPDELISEGNCPVNRTKRAFFTTPRSCNGDLTTIFRAAAWNTGEEDSASTITPGMSNCGKLGVEPSISAKPTTDQAEGPTGMRFSLDIEDQGLTNSRGIAHSDLKKTVLTFPEGVTLNPSAADGLSACSIADFARESLASAPGEGCPQPSKVGTVTVSSPLLEETFEGSLFIATQNDPASPGPENPFDTLLAVYMTVKSPERGVLIKLAAKVEPDLRTGQLKATLDNIPQLPVSHFEMRLNEGARAPLVSPALCGDYRTTAEFTPWSNPSSSFETTSTFHIGRGVGGGPCPGGGVRPFKPGFTAGSINPNAGSYSPFYMRLTRADGEQDMTRFDSVLPPGVVGKIAGVAKCPAAAIAVAKAKAGREELASPSCPAASQIGRTLAGAGVGSELTYVPGKVYLGGPVGGAPLSVIAITPAVAGPFDAGTVVVREALTLDPNTAQVRVDGASSDPIPHILQGIPLKLRDLRIYIDRESFTLNPTGCNPRAAAATLFGSFLDIFNPVDDVPVSLSSRYQAANCANLGFKPKLSLRFTGGTKRNDHPGLKSLVTYPRGPGYSNIGKAVVILPPTEFIDNAHIQNPCTRVQFNAGQCPKTSLLGTAKAITPLLDEPLEGPVYFRSNGGERLLPDVVADLRGLVHIVLVGEVDSVNARIRTTFAQVPDAPVTRFTLNLRGGKKGLLVNNRSLCVRKPRAIVNFTGQNGKTHNTKPVVATDCRKGKGK